MNKIISLLIVIILAVCGLIICASCSAGNDAETDEIKVTGVSAGIDESTAETTAERLAADLPELNLEGRDFTILYCTHPFESAVQKDIYAEEDSDEIIESSVYIRNRNVEELLNCTIKEHVVAYGGVAEEIKKRVLINDSEIDAAAIYLNQFGGIAAQNMLTEYSDMTYIDLDKPWWDKNSVEALSICNKLFAACSDFTIYDKRLTSAMVFNKQLISDYSLESPYDLVKSGDWTLDKLREMSKGIAKDLDGNGIYDDKDIYGIIYCRDSMMSFLNGCGEYMAKKDENDRPYMTVNSTRALEIIESLFDFLYDFSNCFHGAKFFDPLPEPYTDGMTRMFGEDRSLFLCVYMNDVESLRNMDTDFGIIPMPKYDKAQTEYYSSVNPYCGTAIVFPTTIKSAEESSAVIEALSCEGKYILQPAYYDVCLNSKIARDDESSEMLDIIFKNRIYDNGDIYNFGGIAGEFIFMSQTYNRNFASLYERKQRLTEKAINDFIAKFEALE